MKKNNSAEPKKVKASVSETFFAKVKVKKNIPSTILVVDGKQKEFKASSKNEFRFSDIALSNGLENVFPSIYKTFGYKTPSFEFCIKAGYGKVQLGYNRKDYASWKGLLAFNDGQFCTWTWPEKDLTFDTICQLGHKHELTRYRQGKNWITFHYSKAKIKALTAFSKDVLQLVNG